MRKPSAPASGRRERGGNTSSVSGHKSPHSRRACWSLALFAVIFAALAIAATTQAATGVIGYFELGGEFEGSLESDSSTRVGDVGINANGAGGASPGDIYVLGSSVRQLSASNEFIRMWGDNTVKSGPGQANETQGITVDATGGSFKLGFNESTTADIPSAATAGQVESVLNGLASIGAGGASVSGGPGDAGGTNPYVVTFDGSALAGKDQPQLKASDGSTPLSGGGSNLTAYTIQNGGGGFEICEPASGDECRDTGDGSNGDIAIDEANGDVFLTGDNSIERYTADGHFLRSWGRDVVEAGPDDSSNNEVKSVTVKATGGTFTLAYRTNPGSFGATSETSAPLPYNATPAEVETALDNLEKIGGNYSSVTVTGGPGDLTGSNPYLITFHGLLGGDDLLDTFDGGLLGANPNGLTINSGTKSAEVATVTNGGGEEICRARDACKIGAASEAPETPGALELRTLQSGLAMAPAGTPNAGDVVFGDGKRNRVQEYTPEGAFVRTFGWDVDATALGSGFEVCTAESGHVCQEGSSGRGLGQFAHPNGFTLDGVAEDSSGAIYTVEDFGGAFEAPVGDRVQKFNPAGGLDLTPSLFGTDEVQELTVNAGAGQFRLALEFKRNATAGTGEITDGSTTVTDVSVSEGEFSADQPLSSDSGDFHDAQIVAVGSHTLTLSKPLQLGYSGTRTVHLRSNLVYKTPDLPYNASAGEVEAALNALPSVGGIGGSISVMGGPGSPGGSSQYLITFDGGTLARTDPMVIDAEDGAVPLSGGSGTGANMASVVTATPGGPGGTQEESRPFDIGVGPGGNVFVAKLFPQAYTKCPDGELEPFEVRIEELDSSGTVLDTSRPCGGIKGLGPENRRTSLVINELTGHPYLLNQNENANATRVNIYGPIGPDPSLTLDPISGITANGGTISGNINPNGPGTSYPDTTGDLSSVKTTYRVEFKKASDSTWVKYTPDIPLSTGTSPVPVSVGVSGLEPKTEYELKVVAVKPFTATVEEAKSFTTLSAPPEIKGFNSSDLTVSAANLHALINPLGSETSYHFEYGTTPEYGQSTPETNIGEGHSGQAVVDHIEGLKDAVYHFRVVATNSSGTTKSEDQTFGFHPPICPNQTVRQQTGTAYLPDCRAYELVSPENAGGTTLFTGGPQSPYATNPPRLAFVGQYATIPNSGRNPINVTGDLYVATRGAEGWHTRYIGPSSEEAGCVGGRPLTSGAGGPNTMQNDVMADADLNRIINWNLGNPLECFSGAGGFRFFDFNTAARGSNAPYVWNANGDFLARWPTAAGDVPGSEATFSCPQDPKIYPYPPGVIGSIPVSYFCHTFVDASKDLSHFVFSSPAGIYGEGGLTAAPGSAYDNDTAHNTLRLISKQPNGDPIEQEPGNKAGPEELIRFPAVSADGSHILMGTATKPECKQFDLREDLCPLVTQPTHLYMRVDDAITYDVSADYQGHGKSVHYFGATPDGTRVYFTSDEQLTADDTDTSTDLYMWSENGGSPQLTRISKGDTGSAGNTDDCSSSWTTACDVKTYDDTAITGTPGNQGGLGLLGLKKSDPGFTDNSIAANSGDIYFYSSEQLVAGKGAPGKENLYVYREGSVRHVATLEDDLYCLQPSALEDFCSNGALGRLQVTPDGRFAAFITTTRLTAYDNHGFAEMYRYDADAETVKCVSCRPDGKAPTVNVLGSEGGRFITDDGRVFFDTFDPLDPRDTNGGVFEAETNEPLGDDVYEFVDGRPQLITSGLGNIRRVGGSLAGLYGVSANGSDVYFGTFETLVGQDHNGQQLKFYDARTNGGFSYVPPPAPCAAADECHGPTAAAPAPLASGTSAALGGSGNAQGSKPHKHKRRKAAHGAKHRRNEKRHQRAHVKAGGAR